METEAEGERRCEQVGARDHLAEELRQQLHRCGWKVERDKVQVAICDIGKAGRDDLLTVHQQDRAAGIEQTGLAAAGGLQAVGQLRLAERPVVAAEHLVQRLEMGRMRRGGR